MDEHALRHLLRDVASGHLSRRRFTQVLIGLGLTAPMAAQLLGTVAGVHAQPKEPVFTPSQRGGGGPLRTLWWQAPTLLNPHFATGTKDVDASRIFYEPLVGYDPEGNLVPVLAAGCRRWLNGGLARPHGRPSRQKTQQYHQAGDGQGRDSDRDRIRRGLGVRVRLGTAPPTPTAIRTSRGTSRFDQVPTSPRPVLHEPVRLPAQIAGKADASAAPQRDPLPNTCFDRLYRAADAGDLDPVKRAALFVRMNDLVIQQRRHRPRPLAHASRPRRISPPAGWTGRAGLTSWRALLVLAARSVRASAWNDAAGRHPPRVVRREGAGEPRIRSMSATSVERTRTSTRPSRCAHRSVESFAVGPLHCERARVDPVGRHTGLHERVTNGGECARWLSPALYWLVPRRRSVAPSIPRRTAGFCRA